MLKPIGDRVLILPKLTEKVTKNGLYIPEIAQEKPVNGEVIAIGGGVNGAQLTVKVGDIVFYGKHSGNPITHEGVDYLIMKELDIYAVL